MAGQALLASLPDDDNVNHTQRMERHRRRGLGEMIDIPCEDRASPAFDTVGADGDTVGADGGSLIRLSDETTSGEDVASSVSGNHFSVSDSFTQYAEPSAVVAVGAGDDGGAQPALITSPGSGDVHHSGGLRGDRSGSGAVPVHSGSAKDRTEVIFSCDASDVSSKEDGQPQQQQQHRGMSSEKQQQRYCSRRDGCDMSPTSKKVSSRLSEEREHEERMERVRQLKLYDENPAEWLRQFILLESKLLEEHIEHYCDCLRKSMYDMAVRRKRVEQRSEYLRDCAAREGPEVLTPQLVAATPAGHERRPKCTKDDDSTDNDDAGEVLEGFHLPTEVRRDIHVQLPDSISQLWDRARDFFFSRYASAVLQGFVSVRHTKLLSEECLNVTRTLTAWPHHPLNLRKQWANDREEQLRQFLHKWVHYADGHLKKLMAVPTGRPSRAVAHTGVADEGGIHNSTGAQSLLDTASLETSRGDEGLWSEDIESTQPESSLAASFTEGAETSPRAFWGPKTDSADAAEMAKAFMMSRTPCSTSLARLVADTLPGKGLDALLPCLEQPDRQFLNGGFCRLSPYLSRKERNLLRELLQLPLSEMPRVWKDANGHPDRHALRAAEKAIVKRCASPTYDPRGGELTVLVLPTNAFRLQLSNPVVFFGSEFQCDMCCVAGRRVSFQAVLDSGVRSEVVLEYEGCNGYDVCLACSFYYYKSSEMRLLRAVYPSSHLRAPFSFGRFSNVKVHSVRAFACAEIEGDMTVEVVMGVSPYAVMPIGWVLPVNQLSKLRTVCPTLGEDTELTASMHASLPAPPHDWKQHCSVTNIGKRWLETDACGDTAASASGQGLAADAAHNYLMGEDDTCPICLQLLRSPLPVLRTLCGHWFHVECIGSHYYSKPAVVDGEVNENNGCPVCRNSAYMPPLTDTDATMRFNVYRLTIRVPADEVAQGRSRRALEWGGGCAVAVGTLLTEDGVFHNATNIASCEAFYGLRPGVVVNRVPTTDAEKEEAATAAAPAALA
ncbi:hypothetical protein JKF63_05426 [Porcisia hertigi]|uniref:RING-type domain-containing protein n=1 Tax=Porcisia hertigi TaxID=2761500 RepID=A0A836IBE0_9TRYP|nr:hypothetical protein JKF63_05426 [Porcisia hertigi]